MHGGLSLSSKQGIKEDQEALATIVFNEPSPSWEKPDRVLILEGIPYHSLDTEEVPPAFAEVPVILDDNGAIFPVGFRFSTLMHADPLL